MHGAAYTAEDIKRYLRGEMSPAEMHALEKAALDDPFLADAIEGMEKAGGDFDADVNELRKKINQGARKRITPGIYWKAAAVLFILLTAVAIVLLTDNKQPQSEERVLAKVESKKDTPVVIQQKDKEETPQPQEKKEDRAKAVEPTVPVLREQEQTIKSEKELALIQELERPISVADSVQVSATRGDSNKELRALQGKVAGVQVNKTAVHDEVVVAGYGAKKKETETRNNESIVPEGGWEAFYQYLNDNMSATDSLGKGVEVISFTIDKNNRPQAFKIRKSISPAHDKEAIRLLENGPDWKILKGTKRKVRLEIVF